MTLQLHWRASRQWHPAFSAARRDKPAVAHAPLDLAATSPLGALFVTIRACRGLLSSVPALS